MDAHALSRAFDLGGVRHLSPGPVAGGLAGEVWRLVTAEGEWVVKVSRSCGPGPVTEADLRGPTLLQEAAHAAGVPTPQVRRTPSGSLLADVDGALVRVSSWIELDPPDPLLDPEAVGAVVAALHLAAPASTDAASGWYAEPVGAARWDALVARLRDDGAPFAEGLAGLRDELVALESWVAPDRRPSTTPPRKLLCHRDLWADNLRPSVGGGVCVIDWDDAGPADPSQELAAVLFEFARGDAGRARALASSYEAAGGPGKVTGPADLTMLVSQLGHLTEAAASDWLAAGSSGSARSDAADRVGEALDEPHTREVLGRLLEAVGAAVA